jgi:hypothetical protein
MNVEKTMYSRWVGLMRMAKSMEDRLDLWVREVEVHFEFLAKSMEDRLDLWAREVEVHFEFSGFDSERTENLMEDGLSL